MNVEGLDWAIGENHLHSPAYFALVSTLYVLTKSFYFQKVTTNLWLSKLVKIQ